MRTQHDITTEMQAEGKLRDQYNRVNNEGATDGYNPHEDRLGELSDELAAARENESPLKNDLQGERDWFNSQGFTGQDLQKANQACIDRGYSLAELQSACKA